MKPYELFAALMAREGGSSELARKMGKPGPSLQSKLHKFGAGGVKKPAPETGQMIATYFNMPLEAVYDEKTATKIAKERGIHTLPAALIKASEKKPRQQREASFEPDVMKFAKQYAKMNEAERQRLRLLMLAARDGVNPSKIEKAPRDTSQPSDAFLGGDSGLSELDQIPPAPPAKSKKGQQPK